MPRNAPNNPILLRPDEREAIRLMHAIAITLAGGEKIVPGSHEARVKAAKCARALANVRMRAGSLEGNRSILN